jgi:hypothetical protein
LEPGGERLHPNGKRHGRDGDGRAKTSDEFLRATSGARTSAFPVSLRDESTPSTQGVGDVNHEVSASRGGIGPVT